jgi:uncharacterized integral membrane protein
MGPLRGPGRWEAVSFLKLFLGIIFVSAILFFAVLNLREEVVVTLWPGERYSYDRVPLVVAMFGAYLFGIITYFLISLVRDIRLRTQMSRLRKENRSLLSELHHLRSLALDDLPSSPAPEGKVEEGRGR